MGAPTEVEGEITLEELAELQPNICELMFQVSFIVQRGQILFF